MDGRSIIKTKTGHPSVFLIQPSALIGAGSRQPGFSNETCHVAILRPLRILSMVVVNYSWQSFCVFATSSVISILRSGHQAKVPYFSIWPHSEHVFAFEDLGFCVKVF